MDAHRHRVTRHGLQRVARGDLGRRLREARETRGWTLDDLAEAMGVAKCTISRYESGDRYPTDPRLRFKLEYFIRRTATLYAELAASVPEPAPGSPVLLVR